VWSTTEQGSDDPYSTIELALRSQNALQKAYQGAEKSEELHRQVEALTDQIRLVYYMELYPGAPDFKQARARLESGLLSQVEKLIPDHYRIKAGRTHEAGDMFFVRLGNLELLRGHIAFRQWEGQRDTPLLQEAVTHYYFALVYYDYFSEKVFRSKRDGQDRIYFRLSQLQPDQMGIVYETLTRLEQQFGSESGHSQLYMREFLEACFGPPELFTL
jgi:hypothetical protein